MKMKCLACGYDKEISDTWELCLLIPEHCLKEKHSVIFYHADAGANKSPDVEKRLDIILGFNENLAFSLLELAAKFPAPKLVKVLCALVRLERKGKVESKRIGATKYYSIKKTKHSDKNRGE